MLCIRYVKHFSLQDKIIERGKLCAFSTKYIVNYAVF